MSKYLREVLLAKRVSVWMIAVAISLTGCVTLPQVRLTRFEFRRPLMGTEFKIVLYAADKGVASGAAGVAFKEVERLNGLFSDYEPESELMRLREAPVGRPWPISGDLFKVLSEACKIARLTDGAFDPTIGPLVRQWRRARRTQALPDPEDLSRVRDSIGWDKLQFDDQQKTVTLLATNMQLDLGGIGKGYAADQALRVLREHGIGRALAAASGDIATGAAPPGEEGWRVSIGTPFRREGRERTLLLKDAAVSTSGDTEQFVIIDGKHYSHIVDPRTGVGLTNRCQVSVIAPHATQTDAFATAISILGVEAGRRLIEAQPQLSVIIYREAANGIETIEINR